MDADKKFKIEQPLVRSKSTSSLRADTGNARMRALAGLPRLPDMGNEDTLVLRPWGNAPRWRMVAYGLNSEGICKNARCEAFSRYVWCTWGFRNDGRFDYFEHEEELKCPMCKEFVQPRTFGYANTWFQVIGIKRDHWGAPLRPVTTEWKWAPSTGVTTYVCSEKDLVLWGKLVISVSATDPRG